MTYEELEEICGYRERTIRTHCRAYMEYFLHRYGYYRKLPFLLLAARYIEFCLDTELMQMIGEYKSVSMKELPEMVSAYAMSREEKDVVLRLYDCLTGRELQAAG